MTIARLQFRLRLFAPALSFTAALLLPHLLAAESPLPPGGVSLLAGDNASSFSLMASPAVVAPVEVVAVTGQPFQQALRLHTLVPTATPYTAQLRAVTAAPVHAGDVMFVRFHLRSPDWKPGGDPGTTEVTIEQGGPDYLRLVLFGGSAGKEWQEFQMRFVATDKNIGGKEIPAGKANILFRLGYGPQTIEIGGVEVWDFGDKARLEDLPTPELTYPGREADAPWRKAAQERIDRIRKADLTVLVKNANGRPVPGATVTVNMLRHSFGFGSAVAARMILAQTPDGEKYRDTILNYFNKVVMENDLKWQGWEADRQRAIECVKWLRDHGIAVRGHNLVWPSWHFLPKDVEALKDDPVALRKRVDDHITDEVTAMKGQCVEWDVINELHSNHDLTDILGRDSILEWFRLAHQADPAAKLFINDYDTVESGKRNNPHTDDYEATIRYLLQHGAALSGIGIQSHFSGNLPSPAAVLEGLDRFSGLGLELEITEHDIDVADEQVQADYTRDYMTLAFSHPAVTGFLSWGFWEGQHWKPDGAYFRKDWSVKPAGKVWIDLVTKQWWTRASGATDAQGSYSTRGFLGDYEITVTHNGKSKTLQTTLQKGGAPVEAVLE